MQVMNANAAGQMPIREGHAPRGNAVRQSDRPEAGGQPKKVEAGDAHPMPEKARAKGVMRLMEEGHFRGVAAIRLRMNFHEQLQARDTALQTEQVEGAVEALQAGLAESLAGAVEALGEEAAGSLQGLFEQFNKTLAGTLGDDAAEGSAIGGAVTDALAILQEGLAGLAGVGEDPETPAPGTTETAEVVDSTAAEVAVGSEANVEPAAAEVADEAEADVAPVETPTLQSIAGGLLAEVNELAEAYQTSVDSVSSLLDVEGIEPPNGNGVAFEKFLEQYRAMLEPVVVPESDAPVIDEFA